MIIPAAIFHEDFTLLYETGIKKKICDIPNKKWFIKYYWSFLYYMYITIIEVIKNKKYKILLSSTRSIMSRRYNYMTLNIKPNIQYSCITISMDDNLTTMVISFGLRSLNAISWLLGLHRYFNSNL